MWSARPLSADSPPSLPAPGSRFTDPTWRPTRADGPTADFNGANAPISLDQTYVTIGGQNAFVDYISPGQVNVQAPSTLATGQQPIVVSTAAGVSAAYTITVNATQPGLLAPPSFIIGGQQYVVAQFTTTAPIVLPANAISGVTSRPAKPGETIVIYGIGFGTVTVAGRPEPPRRADRARVERYRHTAADLLRILIGHAAIRRIVARQRGAVPVQRGGAERGAEQCRAPDLHAVGRERHADAGYRGRELANRGPR